ncbi:MAG: hypothetical protein CO017_08180, partial [Zetaproteobacteria bacterium CG_4_8_14_3_um_filter_59_5]
MVVSPVVIPVMSLPVMRKGGMCCHIFVRMCVEMNRAVGVPVGVEMHPFAHEATHHIDAQQHK